MAVWDHPVFMASISTILGAILFLRFGYAVGNGLHWRLGHHHSRPRCHHPYCFGNCRNCHQQKSRRRWRLLRDFTFFGINIGAAIGIALFLSQAISISFYIIAFSEAFIPLSHFLNDHYQLGSFGHLLTDKKYIGLASMSFLSLLILFKGANLGIRALYVVASVIFLSLLLFFSWKKHHTMG